MKDTIIIIHKANKDKIPPEKFWNGTGVPPILLKLDIPYYYSKTHTLSFTTSETDKVWLLHHIYLDLKKYDGCKLEVGDLVEFPDTSTYFFGFPSIKSNL
ncbi:hypothetical protein QKU48_gp0074 [Fadolivirus algeromassiliense]|jgi:hypothetical protein|uniref:Uncharacterized protein n=1 Tax=Fadolivirus FV1/VV64 TaxID=3070911 RepID=A0A7D3V5A5_9VIRU|nr:hypothetical protein QKU48_gp0074 [Fadolivirus algeromassiliense]QKF93532.1 hypothetical protein Fadolivirus_1_74 [Fadolivirus FV1/VV64]